MSAITTGRAGRLVGTVCLTAVASLLAPAGAQAVVNGTALTSTTDAYLAKVDVNGRSCSGVLVAADWVLSAKQCFTEAGVALATEGKPTVPVRITVGRLDLATTAGVQTSAVDDVVPHPSRDLALIHLSTPTSGIAPVTLATKAVATGDKLRLLGFGRTATEWVPDKGQAAPGAVATVSTETLTLQAASTTCQGDSGGPAVRARTDGSGVVELVAVHSRSWQRGCLGETETRNQTIETRVDDQTSWIRQHTAVYSNIVAGRGVGGFDLSSDLDDIVPFDYDHSGRADHFVVYRPGSNIVYIVKHGTDTTLSPVLTSRAGIGGVSLADARDRIIPFDYEHTGRLDHLVVYRPGTRSIAILRHDSGTTFTPVFRSTSGIGGYDLYDARDRIVAFDYEHSGKQDHLLLYRPGGQSFAVAAHTGTSSTFSTVILRKGVAGFDLNSANDRIVPFDLDHTGRKDGLVVYRAGTGQVYFVRHTTGTTMTSTSTKGIGGFSFGTSDDAGFALDYASAGRSDALGVYRPGSRIFAVMRHNADDTYTPVVSRTAGVCGFDLSSTKDRVLAFDWNHTGKEDHLVIYRRGLGNGQFFVCGRGL